MSFGVTHIQDSLLLPASFENAVLLLMPAHGYVTNPNKPKGEVPARAFYKAALLYARALHVLYFLLMDANPDKFGSGGFGDFLAVKV